MDKEIISGLINGAICALACLSFIRFVWPRNENVSAWKVVPLVIALGIIVGALLGLIESHILK
jgi:hypothetical protein